MVAGLWCTLSVADYKLWWFEHKVIIMQNHQLCLFYTPHGIGTDLLRGLIGLAKIANIICYFKWLISPPRTYLSKDKSPQNNREPSTKTPAATLPIPGPLSQQMATLAVSPSSAEDAHPDPIYLAYFMKTLSTTSSQTYTSSSKTVKLGLEFRLKSPVQI